MVSHSEYWTGESAQVIARLYDWQGSPITVTNCTVDIFYPNKSPFVSGALTTDTLQTTTGTHYYLFTVPSTEGIYQYMVTCNYPNQKTRSVASTFHVSPALNMQKVINMTLVDLSNQEQTHFNIGQVNFSNINLGITVIQSKEDIIILNLTDIDAETDYIRANMLTSISFDANFSQIINNEQTIITQGGNILNNISALENFCGDAVTSGSQLCLWVNSINNKVTDVNATVKQYTAILAEINTTTHSTYDYMTGTLATNINNIFGIVQSTQATAIQINTTVTDIQSTVNAVKTNQEDQVYMEVTS
jgi:hypothetical protein